MANPYAGLTDMRGRPVRKVNYGSMWVPVGSLARALPAARGFVNGRVLGPQGSPARYAPAGAAQAAREQARLARFLMRRRRSGV